MTGGEDTGLDIDLLRSWIGREDVAVDVLGEDLARKYHATFDAPGDPPRSGELAPRLIHFCVGQPVASTATLGDDGHPARGGFLPPVPLPRRMWAGGELTFHNDLRVGDTVTRRSRIEDVLLKQGRSGPLCFVTVRHRIEVRGALVAEERQDIVYRGVDRAEGAGKVAASTEQGVHHRLMKADAPLLFRYSALTFNAHRIHYDRSYAEEVERYPGLVVHGPLQAALLCSYATELSGVPPRRFGFRGLSPLFDGEIFGLHATAEQDVLKIWTAKENGTLCMSAEASWS